jgi:hypothetical protein
MSTTSWRTQNARLLTTSRPRGHARRAAAGLPERRVVWLLTQLDREWGIPVRLLNALVEVASI